MRDCPYCGTGIERGEECRIVHYYYEDYREMSFHLGCFEEYEKLLKGEEAIKRGDILGLCYFCEKPVRQNDSYAVIRVDPWGDCDNESKFITTIPQRRDIWLQHQVCCEYEKAESFS